MFWRFPPLKLFHLPWPSARLMGLFYRGGIFYKKKKKSLKCISNNFTLCVISLSHNGEISTFIRSCISQVGALHSLIFSFETGNLFKLRCHSMSQGKKSLSVNHKLPGWKKKRNLDQIYPQVGKSNCWKIGKIDAKRALIKPQRGEWKEIAFNCVLRWINPLYLEGGDLFTVCTSSPILLPCSAEPNECVTCSNSTAQILCRASWCPLWVEWGKAPFAFQFCILLLRGNTGMKGKGKRRDITKFNTDDLFEGRSVELKWKSMENFQARQFLAVVGTNVIINYENWGMEQDRELYTFTGPGLPIYWSSLFSADFWINHSPCAMEMSWLSKHEVHQTLHNDCGTFRGLNQSPVEPHQKKSHPKRANWNEPSSSERCNFPALGSVWYCFF